MNILSLDPGPTQTGWAIVHQDMKISAYGIEHNKSLLTWVAGFKADMVEKLAIEMIASYGMPVGREVFETCIWIGRFMQTWRAPEEVMLVYRKDVKIHLCGKGNANDANVRQAIIDLYPPTGGGSTPQIGTKAQPGPLYGVTSHIWPAIGVGLVAHQQCGKLKMPDTLPLYQTNGDEAPAPF